MSGTHTSSRLLSALLTGASLHLRACISTMGEGFTEKYAGTCKNAGSAHATSPVQDGPAEKAAKARLVEQLGGDASESLQLCYEQALANLARMQGRILLRLSVNAQGSAETIHVVENTTKYEAFACCIAAVVRKLTWPPTAAGASVQIEYPFTFGLVRMPYGYKRDIGLEFKSTQVRPEGYSLHLDGLMRGDP